MKSQMDIRIENGTNGSNGSGIDAYRFYSDGSDDKDGTMLGYAQVMKNGISCTLDYFQVEEGLRGQGIGRACLMQLEGRLLSEGVQVINLTSYPWTVPFYYKYGYRLTDGRDPVEKQMAKIL